MNIKKSTAGILLGLVASSSLAYAESNPQHREMLQSSEDNQICFYDADGKALKVSVIKLADLENAWKVTGTGDNNSSESKNDIVINLFNSNCIQAKTTRHGSTDVTKKLLERIGNNSTIYNTGSGVTNTADFTSDSKLNLAFSIKNIEIGSTIYPEMYFAQGTSKYWYVYTPTLTNHNYTYYTVISAPVPGCTSNNRTKSMLKGNVTIENSGHYGLKIFSFTDSDLCKFYSSSDCEFECL